MDVMVCLVIVVVLLWIVCFVEVLTSGSRVLPWVLVLLLAVIAVTVVKALYVWARYVWMCVWWLLVSLCRLVSVLFVVICSPHHSLLGPVIPQWSLDLPICLVLSAMPCLAEVVVLL